MTVLVMTWADKLEGEGKAVTPGRSHPCPKCRKPEHAFAIVRDDNGDWACSSCRTPPIADDILPLTWADIRGQRTVFMQTTDWTQLPDVPEATRQAFVAIRQRARDLTEAASVTEAMSLLDALVAEAAAMAGND